MASGALPIQIKRRFVASVDLRARGPVQAQTKNSQPRCRRAARNHFSRDARAQRISKLLETDAGRPIKAPLDEFQPTEPKDGAGCFHAGDPVAVVLYALWFDSTVGSQSAGFSLSPS